MLDHVIPASVPEMSLSRYITRAWPLLPSWVLREAFKRRDIRVNGQRRSADYLVRGGDSLRLYLAAELLTPPLETVFDDGKLIACVKPQGLPVDADMDGIGADTLLSRLRSVHPGAELCHRLDAGTGGVVLCAADPGVLEAVLHCFKEHRLRKRYIAVAGGKIDGREGTFRDYLTKDAGKALVRISKNAVSKNAKPIETRWEVLENSADGLHLLALEPVTGRTHQLRAHLAFHGLPILGDDKYGDRALNRFLPQKYPCLWCQSLILEKLPGFEKYENIVFSAPVPDSFSSFFKTRKI